MQPLPLLRRRRQEEEVVKQRVHFLSSSDLPKNSTKKTETLTKRKPEKKITETKHTPISSRAFRSLQIDDAGGMFHAFQQLVHTFQVFALLSFTTR
jgi:hypothetical protein